MKEEHMEISQRTEGEAKILEVEGRLDSNTAPEFEETLFQAIRNGSRKVVIDCGALAYISSAGLRVILKAAKDMKRSEGRLVLCALQDYVREVFEISGFDSFLPIVPSVDDAMKSSPDAA
jgi:anti-sigma B factor antagonist